MCSMFSKVGISSGVATIVLLAAFAWPSIAPARADSPARFDLAQAPVQDPKKCQEFCPGKDCPSACRRDGPGRGDRPISPVEKEKEPPPGKRSDGPERGDPKAGIAPE